jgi:hypothetical protein
MTDEILDQLRQISQALYNIVIKTAKNKWDPVKVEKQSESIYIVKMAGRNEPGKEEKYKCVFNGNRWFIV